MSAQHTPGPWELHSTFDGDGIETNVCGAIKARFNRNNKIMQAEAEANARLIAAAPELLEALREVAKRMARNGSGDVLFHSMITSAIAKAEGK